MPHKEFAAATNTEPVTFLVGGDLFKAAPQCPAGVMLAVASSSSETSAAQATVDFLNAVLLPESRELFNQRLVDAANPISMTQLTDILGWLMEVYTGRPTVTPSPSPAGPSPSGESSTASSPEMAQTS